MAACARTGMLIKQEAILHELFIDSFGGGIRGKGTRRIAGSYLHRTLRIGSALPNPLESKVIEMAPPEETLHHYLRRHFEKVSKGNARQFAEQRETPQVDVVPDTRTSDGSGSYRIAKPFLTHYH